MKIINAAHYFHHGRQYSHLKELVFNGVFIKDFIKNK